MDTASKKTIKIWLTWERQRRNLGLSDALNFELYEILYDNLPKFRRYFLSIIRTIIVLKKNRPSIVVAQNPSIVLALLIVILKIFFKYYCIIDSHNAGIYPSEDKTTILTYISRFIQRYADLTLVTNKKLKMVVEYNGGKAFVLQDKIPIKKGTNNFSLKGKYNIAYICTFSDDEPWENVIKAGKLIPEYIHIHFTGNYKKKNININSLPSNIKMLGFIADEDYWTLLNSVDFVMDLTYRENCLVCGAYEGLSVEKPQILSDTIALTEYFNKGCIYVMPSSQAIADGIISAIMNEKDLQLKIQTLKSEINQKWQERLDKLQELLNSEIQN